MTEMPEFLINLWNDSRPSLLVQADEAAIAAAAWAQTADPEAWEALRFRAHKLVGSVGSFAVAVRPTSPNGPHQAAALAARALDDAVTARHPDPQVIPTLANRLRECLEAT